MRPTQKDVGGLFAKTSRHPLPLTLCLVGGDVNNTPKLAPRNYQHRSARPIWPCPFRVIVGMVLPSSFYPFGLLVLRSCMVIMHSACHVVEIWNKSHFTE